MGTHTPRYRVLTWDTDQDRFTPQDGVRSGPHTLMGLRKALRKLQAFGYPCDRDDPSVLVERLGPYRWPASSKGPTLGWVCDRRARLERERRG